MIGLKIVGTYMYMYFFFKKANCKILEPGTYRVKCEGVISILSQQHIHADKNIFTPTGKYVFFWPIQKSNNLPSIGLQNRPDMGR